MPNLGQITPVNGTKWLREQVGLSKAFTKEDIDRFTFRSTGQAGSYYYGHTQQEPPHVAHRQVFSFKTCTPPIG